MWLRRRSQRCRRGLHCLRSGLLPRCWAAERACGWHRLSGRQPRRCCGRSTAAGFDLKVSNRARPAAMCRWSPADRQQRGLPAEWAAAAWSSGRMGGSSGVVCFATIMPHLCFQQNRFPSERKGTSGRQVAATRNFGSLSLSFDRDFRIPLIVAKTEQQTA